MVQNTHRLTTVSAYDGETVVSEIKANGPGSAKCHVEAFLSLVAEVGHSLVSVRSEWYVNFADAWVTDGYVCDGEQSMTDAGIM